MSDDIAAAWAAHLAGPDAEPTGPTAPDEAAIERMHKDHAEYLKRFDHEDPNGLFFKRPETAKRYREEYEQRAKVLFARMGVPEPVVLSPLAEAQRQHDASYQELSPGYAEMIDSQLERLEALPAAELEMGVVALQNDLAEREYHKLEVQYAVAQPGTMERPPNKAEYIRTNGPRLHSQLVAAAQAALKEPLPKAAHASKYVLMTLAAQGAYNARWERSRPH